ncbi:MAG: single-stranded-DNA-specific exonuclease RecJ [Sarcina sp.]
MLLNRGINTIEEAKFFLEARVDDFYDPYLMKDMKKAVLRIKKAIETKERITIYGDYDCDGVSSTSILYKAFERCGANFDYHIPNREDEGYGMNCNRIKILKEKGTSLIVTCDNGIAAFEEIKLANDLGMEVILTDHHDIQLIDDENGNKVLATPNAFAVVNPHQEECKYPFELLCGAGIAFKLCLALYDELNLPKSEALSLIEICAIATVCDVVSLQNENRIIVKEGLKRLTNSNNIGINALKKATNLEDKEITAYHLGFVIGPCINATGRLETADLSVELLITKNQKRAEELANELVELNERRKELTAESVEEVIKQIEKEKLYNDKVLLVYNPNIHESIAGIVAGRVKEKYNLPTIVMTKGKEMPKGSARSIEEYNIFEELTKCKELMEKFGGHPMAAGLSAYEENLPKLRKKLNDICELTDEDLTPKVRIDMAIPISHVNDNLLDTIANLEPFGKGNVTPVIADKRILVKSFRVIGKEGTHVKFECLTSENGKVDGLLFNRADEFREMFNDRFGNNKFEEYSDGRLCRFYIDAIYKPDVNEFRGQKTFQILINNIRISE